jgi:hypothetical protein
MYTFYPNGSLIPDVRTRFSVHRSLLLLVPPTSLLPLVLIASTQAVVNDYLAASDSMYSELEGVAAQMADRVEPDRSLLEVIKEIGFLNDSMPETEHAVRNWMLWYYFGWAYGEQLEYDEHLLSQPLKKNNKKTYA